MEALKNEKPLVNGPAAEASVGPRPWGEDMKSLPRFEARHNGPRAAGVSSAAGSSAALCRAVGS